MDTNHPAEQGSPSPLLTIDQVCARTTLGRTSIYSLVQKQLFPQPVKLTAKASRWERAAVDAWVQARIDAAGGAAA